MSSYRLTPRARDGLLRIALHVEDRFGGEVADRVLRDVERALQRIAASPAIGHGREDLTDDASIRFWSEGPSLIAYREHERRIDVLFIERGDVDWDRLLSSG